MAYSTTLAAPTRASIAEQVAARTPPSSAFAAEITPLELGETFEIQLLPLDQVLHGEGPLAMRVRPTGHWHHQLYRGDRASMAAATISISGDPGDAHKVVAVTRSGVPQALQETIEWIDTLVDGNAKAELLMAPDYQLVAVWLRSEADQVVVVMTSRSVEGLPRNQLLDADLFLQRLATNATPVGLPSGPAVDRPSFDNDDR